MFVYLKYSYNKHLLPGNTFFSQHKSMKKKILEAFGLQWNEIKWNNIRECSMRRPKKETSSCRLVGCMMYHREVGNWLFSRKFNWNLMTNSISQLYTQSAEFCRLSTSHKQTYFWNIEFWNCFFFIMMNDVQRVLSTECFFQKLTFFLFE